MVDNKENDNQQDLDEQDKPITVRQLNQALTNYRRQTEKDFQKALAALSQREEPTTNQKDETLTLREQIKALQEKDRQRDALLKQELMNKSINDVLSKNGIDSKYLSFAFKAVKDDISYDQDGTLVMKDHYGVNVPLSEALSNWSKSEQAEIFRSPKNIQGSGSQAVRNSPTVHTPNTSGKPNTPEEAKSMLLAALRNGESLTR